MEEPTVLGRRLGLAAGAVALAVAGMTLASLPAQAASTHYTGHFTYYKNKAHPASSKMTWWWTKYSGSTKVGSGHKTWRAGSGSPPGITNSCATNHGWLPNGWYDGLEHSTYWSSIIPTMNWELTDHKCSSGKYRTALFIHSKTPSSWKAASQPYYSNGCVHLSPTDIKDADKYTRAHGGPSYGSHKFHHLLYVTYA
jgi:hypothetical protein